MQEKKKRTKIKTGKKMTTRKSHGKLRPGAKLKAHAETEHYKFERRNPGCRKEVNSPAKSHGPE